MSKSPIESLLWDTTVQLKALEKSEERFAKELAPNFRPFDLFRVDEMTVSRCLASLLDPKGKHGQGPLFLESFLEQFELKEGVRLNEKTRISTEFHLGAPGRIDILLELDGFTIAIENKPWAAFGDNQIGRYADWLKSRGDGIRWLLICLANEDPPDSALDPKTRDDLDETGQYLQIDFRQIEEWLAEVALQSRALPVRIFVEELSKYIRYHINGALEMAEVEEIERLVKDPENLKSAVAIANAWSEIRKKKLQLFKEQLENTWEDGSKEFPDHKLEWSPNMDTEGAECWFGFVREADQVFMPCFAFGSSGLRNFYWGVSTKSGKIPSEHKDAADAIFELLNTAFQENGKSSSWWPWYLYPSQKRFGEEMSNWQSSAVPWQKISKDNHELADEFIKLVVEVYEHLDARPELLCGRGK